MHRSLRALLPALTTLALGSCGTDPDGQPSSGATLSPADTAIAAQLYAGTPRTPPGFVDDPVPPGYLQVTTYHIDSSQLDPGAATNYELCTDDWTEALAWSETLAQQAPAYLDLVGNGETERYFELDRVPRGSPEQYVRMRVFRCSYLDRAGVSLAGMTEFAGTFNYRPLDSAALRELSEYLWRFTTYNNVDHIVLASSVGPAASGLSHVLTLTSLTRGAGVGSCDRIVVHEWTHGVDTNTGSLTRTDTALRQFDVRPDGDAILGC